MTCGAVNALADHRGGRVLAHAADRDPLLARDRGHRRPAGPGPGPAAAAGRGRGRLHVVPGDRAVRAGAGQPRSGRRRGPWPACGPAAWPARPAPARRRPRPGRPAVRPAAGGRDCRRPGWRRGQAAAPGRRAAGRGLPRPPGGRAQLDPVADEHGLALRPPWRPGLPSMPGSVAPSAGGWGIRSSLRGARDGRPRRPTPASPGAASAPTSTEMIGVPTSTVVPSGTSRPGHHARVRARQLDDGLGRLDLDDDLVDLDRVAGLHVPLDDVRLGQALADVRKLELLEL